MDMMWSMISGQLYRGLLEEHQNPVVMVERPVGDGESLVTELPLRLDLMNCSPCGFSWGYGGSGPSQLSLALLAHVLGVPEAPAAPEEEDPEYWAEDEEPVELDDGALLLDGQTTLSTQRRGGLALMLSGVLLGDVVSQLPQRTPWVIAAADVLEWVRAEPERRPALAEKILRAAVSPRPAKPHPGPARPEPLV